MWVVYGLMHCILISLLLVKFGIGPELPETMRQTIKKSVANIGYWCKKGHYNLTGYVLIMAVKLCDSHGAWQKVYCRPMKKAKRREIM